MIQYAVTKKNGACLLTTDYDEAWKVAEASKAELWQVQPERRLIAQPTWLDGEGVQNYKRSKAKYNGLVEMG
jgi:hypothetical protein